MSRNSIPEGMAKVYEEAFLSAAGKANTRVEAMSAILLWLANNVTDGMVQASKIAQSEVLSLPADIDTDTVHRACIAIALRQAAEVGDVG